MERHALIAGVSGIIGRHLAEHLIANDWAVTGISRHKHDLPKGVKHIAVDLTDDEATSVALKRVKPTDVFITTWLRQATEAENCRVNAGMVRNLLGAMDGNKIKHAALVTGAKHYMARLRPMPKPRWSHLSAKRCRACLTRIFIMIKKMKCLAQPKNRASHGLCIALIL